MESPMDRDVDAKIIFLWEAVRGTEWGLRDTSRVTEKLSYQIQTSTMNT